MLIGFMVVTAAAIVCLIGWGIAVYRNRQIPEDDEEQVLEFRKNLLGAASGYLAWYFGVDLEKLDETRISFSKPNPYATMEQIVLNDAVIGNIEVNWLTQRYYIVITIALENNKNLTKCFKGKFGNGYTVNFEKLGDWLLKNFKIEEEKSESEKENAAPQKDAEQELQEAKTQLLGLMLRAYDKAPDVDAEELKESYYSSLMLSIKHILSIKDNDIREKLLTHLGKELLYVMKFTEDEFVGFMVKQVTGAKNDEEVEAFLRDDDENEYVFKKENPDETEEA